VPATRQLVHSGFGYGNVRVKDGRVTAVLDWTDPRIGDGLYDAASYDFWRAGDNFLDEYRRFCAGRGIRHGDFDERIRCYKYYCGLDAMRYFAKNDNRKAYEQAVQILRRLGGGPVS
jgi:hygromycin-B 4-O-kinase